MFRNCNKKGMHAVVYYRRYIAVIQNLSDMIYQTGKLKF
jgi:hypothetical protein